MRSKMPLCSNLLIALKILKVRPRSTSDELITGKPDVVGYSNMADCSGNTIHDLPTVKRRD